MVCCRGIICSSLELTLRETIVRELHDVLLERQTKAIYEHEVQWMVDFDYRRVSRLQVVSRCIIKC